MTNQLWFGNDAYSYLRLVNKVQLWLGRLLSLAATAIAVLYFVPIFIELSKQRLQGDNLGLLVVVGYLTVLLLTTLVIWAKPTWVNSSRFLKFFLKINALLLGVLYLVFTYSNWLLLVVTIAGFYVWLNRLFKKSISNSTNTSIIGILTILISIYVVINVIG